MPLGDLTFSPRSPGPDAILVSTLRLVIRSEVGDIFKGSLFREAMRDEVSEAMRQIVLPKLEEGALQAGRAQKKAGSVECPAVRPAEVPVEEGEEVQSNFSGGTGGENRKSVKSMEISCSLPISHFVEEQDAHKRDTAPCNPSYNPEKSLWENLTMLHHWWLRLQEDPLQANSRIGKVADGPWLSSFMCLVVVVDVAMMIYVSDRNLRQVDDMCSWCNTIDWLSQLLYTMEVLIKLVAHRHWFFVNKNWRENWFDLLLVLSGFVGRLMSGSSVAITRILRLLRLARAFRAVKVMTRVRHLNTFVVCISGSIQPFFWSLVMLATIFMIFSLCFAQLTIGYLEEGMSMSGELEEMFGSVPRSILTLYMAVTGGDDWSRAFGALSSIGWEGGVLFLLFIAFTSLALINIITGMFVEAAMQTLAPDPETSAKARAEQEQAFAKDLERLCILVDHDESGKLTPQQFRDGIHQGRIPTLLALLGLREEHVLKLFEQMSLMNAHDDGQVNIHSFVKACMTLKGPGTHFDLQQVLEELKRMQDVLKAQQDELVRLKQKE